MALTIAHEPWPAGAEPLSTCPHCGTTKARADKGETTCRAREIPVPHERKSYMEDLTAFRDRLAELRKEREAATARASAE